MNKMLAGLLLFVSTIPAAWSAGFDIALSNETAYLSMLLNQNPLNFNGASAQDGGVEVSVGVFVNEPGDNLIHATLMARGIRQSIASQYQLSTGVKFLSGKIEIEENRSDVEEKVGAAALGFQVALLLQASTYNPLEFSVEGYYAPKIASFSDAERYGELSARLQIEIMPRVRTFIGYRRMRFDTKSYEKISLDQSAHIGISVFF